jgi:hypothetical protein
MFVNPDYDDFSLQSSSPCIGTGRNGGDRGAIPYQTTGIEDKTSVPIAFELLENYPNPFNASTTIRYSLKEPADVIIEIFDILGRNIEAFNIGQRAAGDYSITWDADDVPSGVYFYRLIAGSTIQTRQMLLLK